MEPQDNKQSTTAKIKQKIEQKVKNKILKIVLTWIVMHIIPIILVLLVATLLLLIIQLNMNTVKDTFESMKNTISQIFASEGNDEKSKQDNYSIKDELKAMIKISDDGSRFEQKSEFSKIMIQRLKDAQINTTQMYYTEEDYDPEEDANNLSDDELKNMIDKYIRAEVKTMFPKIRKDDNGIDGIVKIRRTGYRAEADSESYIDEELEYVPYSQLKAEASETVEEDSIAAEYLKHFSLNPDTFELCLLVENRQYIWKDDEEHEGKPDTTRITFTMNEFDYQTALEPYATPVNFFVSLHQIVDDVDLMNELVDKVKNSTITLTYVEVPVITNSLWKYRGTLTTYEDTETVTTVTAIKYNEIRDEQGELIRKDPIDTYNHTETTATTPQVEVRVEQLDTRKKCKVYLDEIGHEMNPAYTRNVSNSANLIVQEANTWILETKKIINQGNARPLPVGNEDDDGPIEGEAKGWEYHQFIKKEPTQTPSTYYPKAPSGYEDINATSELYTYQTKKFSITGKNSKDRFSYTTNVVDKGGGIKTDEVIEFLNTYPRAKNNLLTSPSMFYYYLEQNENTQELEKDMKIIIEKITGIKQPEGRSDYFDDNSIFSDLINKGQEIISGTTEFNGKTYKNIKQKGSDWCGIACATIVINGYGGYNLTQDEIHAKYRNANGNYLWRQAISDYIGGGDYGYDIPNGIIKQLNAGKPTIIHITPNNGVYKTSGGHFVVLLGIREKDGDLQFNVSDVGGNYIGRGRNGWVSSKIVLKYCDKYVIIK